jgi:hypothetical protein
MKAPAHEIQISELRHFGWLFAALVAGLFGLLIPWLSDRATPLWPVVLGAVVFLLATLLPGALKPLYRGWMAFGSVAGWINTRIILWLMYYLVLVPTGLLMRAFGKDPMKRKLDPKVKSYRVISEVQEPTHMEKPF